MTITENFDGNSNTFTASPASAWKIDNNYSVSSPNAIRGVVPNMTGGETTLTSPVYDLSNYSNVLLRFRHICKISPLDTARVEYKIKNMSWKVVPVSAYLGKINQSGMYEFNANTYSEWIAGDSLVLPLQSWWKEEVFDIGHDVGGDDGVQFRFILKHGNTIGTQISYGWLIDNIEIIAAPYEIKPPVVEFVAPFVKDTVYSIGPWEINAKVKSQTTARIENPWLVYTATNHQGVIKDSILMMHVRGDSLWKASIPQFIPGTKIIYYISGSDTNKIYYTETSSYIIKKTDNYGDTSVALTNIISPVQGQIIGDTIPVEIVLSNKGDSILTSAIINWSLNGVVKNPYLWTGNLLCYFEQKVTIGTYQPSIGQYDTIVIWVSMPNGVQDVFLMDDTVSVVIYGCVPNMFGTYIVGQGGTFPVLKDAMIALNVCSLTGDITFALKSDVYAENLNLTNVSNIMGNYTLTITSLANDKDSVILRPVSGVGILLNNSNNIRIEHITIDVDSSGTTYGIQFTGTCTNVVINQCNILGKLTGTTETTAYAPVYKATNAGSLVNTNITNCTIQGGYYGIYLYGASANYCQNITIDSNIINNQSYYGVYLYYVNLNSVSYNQVISHPSSQGTTWYGLSFNYARNGGNIMANRIKSDNSGISSILYGMYINYIDNALVANNEIYLNSSAGTTYGMYLYYSYQVDYLHNTVLLTGNGGSTFRAVQVYVSTSASYSATYKNNIFIANGGTTPYAVYLSAAPGATFAQYNQINYNNYYSSGNLGFAGSDLSDLDSWKSIVSTDSNSINFCSDFIDSTVNLKLSNYTNMHCNILPNVDCDIENIFRIGAFTVMGCYHDISITLNATLKSITGWRNGSVLGQTDSIRIQLINTAKDTITALTLNWSINGNLQTAINWSGFLSAGQSISLIGRITYTSGPYVLKVWISAVNGSQDEFAKDDTISISGYVCNAPLNGTYTIGATGMFLSFEDALEYLLEQAKICGINGDIVFAFQTGTYMGNLDLSNISLGYRLTITSTTNKAEDVVFQTESVGMTLSNSNNIVIKNITIDATAGTYVIRFTDACTNIVIRDCKLLANPTTSSSNAVPIYKASTGIVNSIFIINNLLDGGCYGIFFYGGTGYGAGQYGTNIVIDSNTVSNQYSRGIHLYYANLTSCSYNTILSRTTDMSTTWYAIYMEYSNSPVIGNRILQRNDNISFPRGIYLSYYHYYNTTNTGLVANNEIILYTTGTNANNNGGIYTYQSRINKVLHNSIYIKGTGVASGIYIQDYIVGGSNMYTIKNNNIIMESTKAYPVYLYTYSNNLSHHDMDYNNMYAPNYVGYVDIGVPNGDKLTIEEWQQTIITDQHSVRVPPNFIDSTLCLELSNYRGLECNPLSDVSIDKQGNLRTGITSMGCYTGFRTYPTNALLYDIQTQSGVMLGTSDTIKVVLVNMGTNPLTSATLNWSFNGLIQSASGIIWSGYLNEGASDTVVLGVATYTPAGYYTITAWIKDLGSQQDMFSGDDTVQRTAYICSSPLNGTYTIGTTGTYKTINEALDIMNLCGVSGDVILAFQPGNYNEFIYLRNSSLLMGTHTLTLTSTTHNASDVRIITDNVSIILGNSNNIRIEDLTIDATAGNYAIQFIDSCTNVIIQNCHLLADTTTNTSPKSAVYKASGTGVAHNISIRNNLLEGGYYGICFYGGTGTSAYGTVIIDSNTISKQYNTGIYGYNTDFTSISANTITSQTSPTTAVAWNGIVLMYCNGNITANHIKQQSNTITQPYGINIQRFNYYNTTNKGLIANNEIMLYTTGKYYGIYVNTYTSADILHNSIYMAGSGAAVGIQIQNSARTTLTVKNNNIVMESSDAFPVYLSAITNLVLWDINANNYYAPQYIGYAGGAKTSLTAWMDVVTTDINSINIQPDFIDSTLNLQLENYRGFECMPLMQVPDDIDKQYRIGELTVVGCYHGFPYAENARLSLFSPMRGDVRPGTGDTVKVEITNAGTTAISSATIYWSFNGSTPQPFSWSGYLTSVKSIVVTLGNITFTTGKNTLDIWIDNLGSLQDENRKDDTVHSVFYACNTALSGIYTIGETGVFTTIKQAIAQLNFCGVSGDVTLALQTGTFMENIDLTDIALVLGGYNLTITSATGNAEDVVIKTNDYGIILHNSNNITVSSLTIDVKSGYGIYLADTTNNIVIRDCIILSDSVSITSSNTSVPIYKMPSMSSNNISIVNNVLYGGLYGIYFQGGNSVYSSGIRIDSNIIQSICRYGILVAYTDFESISSNNIQSRRTEAVNDPFDGIYLISINGNIIGNRISIFRGTTGQQYRGIFVSEHNRYNTTIAGIISNNEIIFEMSYVTAGDTKADGITMESSYSCVMNNSIRISGDDIAKGNLRGIGIEVLNPLNANIVTIRNNIIDIEVTNSTIIISLQPLRTERYYSHAILLSELPSQYDIDYNNLIAYYIGAIGDGLGGNSAMTLDVWQQFLLPGGDMHSVCVKPNYIDSTINLQLSDYSGLLCPSDSRATKDIRGYIRPNRTTMGAYNGTAASLDLEIQKLICNDTAVLYPQTISAQIDIINKSINNTIDSATFGWSINGEIQLPYTWKATNPLVPDENMEISIGSFNPVKKTNIFDIVVWIESVNGGKDSVRWNDTIKITVNIYWTGNNLNIQSIYQLTPDGALCTDDYVPLKIKVANTGILDYDFAVTPVRIYAQVTQPEAFYLDTILSIGEIKSGKTVTIELIDKFPIIAAGQYDITVWMDSIDYIAYDDTSTLIYVSEKFDLPIDENFSNGIPVVFTSKGLNTSHTWEVVSQGTGIDTAIQPVFGDSILSFGGSPGSMTTLFTQQLDLSHTLQPSLSFWYFHDTIPCEDYTDVRITIDGGTTYITLFSLTKYDVVYGWRQYSMDLPSYAVNQCVILVFEAMEKSRSGDVTQYIDRICIIAKQDIKVESVLASEYSVCDLEDKELKVVLSNLTDPVLDFTATPTEITLEVKETGQTFTYPLTNGSLGSFASDTFTLETDFDFAKGTYTFKAYFSSVLDVDRQNDTLETSLVINPELNPLLVQVSGNNSCLSGETPIWQEVTLTNTGNMDLFDIELVLQIDTGETGSPAYFTLTEICTDTIRAGDSHLYTFKEAYTVPWNADYYPRIYASLPCNRGLIDITTAIVECVDMTDLYIVSIDNPSAGNDKVGDAVQVRTTLHNRSNNKTFAGLDITVLVTNSQGVQMAKFTEMTEAISISAMASHTFTDTFTVPNDTVYYLTVYINSYENYPRNDTMTITRYTDGVDITSLGVDNAFTLGQNIPNPATNSTRIDYNVPEAGKVIFHVHSITGQLLYSKTIETERGTNSIELNTSTFAAGVYFYSMEYKGQRLVKQLIINN
jgi:hypothetical protein